MSRWTKPCPSPRVGSDSATLGPRSSCRSAMTTVAPAAARAWAIPSPRPWAPPVTRALRPVRSRSVMPAPRGVGRRGVVGGHNVARSLDDCQDFSGHLSRKSRSTVKDGLPLSYSDAADATREEASRVARHQAGATRAGRQARRAARPARRVGAAHPRRARLRPHQPARDRQQLRVQPRRRPLLLRRQARADRLLRPLLQGPLRDPLRRRGRRRDRAPRSCSTRFAAKLVETRAGRGADAPPLVRPAHPEHVRGAACARRSR